MDTIALNCLVLGKKSRFWHFGDSQTNRQTNKQMDSNGLISRPKKFFCQPTVCIGYLSWYLKLFKHRLSAYVILYARFFVTFSYNFYGEQQKILQQKHKWRHYEHSQRLGWGERFANFSSFNYHVHKFYRIKAQVVLYLHNRLYACILRKIAVMSLSTAIGGYISIAALLICSGVTPIGQGWTNARGLRGLGGPKPDRKLFLYILIFQVWGVSHLLYSTADFCERPLRISLLFCV